MIAKGRDNMDFGTRLKQYRQEQGYTGASFAEKIGLPYQTYMAYESKGIEPNYTTLRKIASALNVTIDNLLDYELDGSKLEAARARFAGLVVTEKNGMYSVTIPSRVLVGLDAVAQRMIDHMKLDPLPAKEFAEAVKLARQHLMDDNPNRFILWILEMIDHQHYLKSQENPHIPLPEQERMEKMKQEKEQKKELPPSEG